MGELRTRERQLKGHFPQCPAEGEVPQPNLQSCFSLGGHLGAPGEPGDWVWLIGCALRPPWPSFRNVPPRGPIHPKGPNVNNDPHL